MSKPSHTHVRTIERQYSAHHLMFDIAKIQIESAEKDNSQGYKAHESCLISITFSALGLEAALNAIGVRLFDRWNVDFEKCNPIAKLRLIAESLKVDYSHQKKPWADALWLFSFRNKIAHAKPEVIENDVFLTQAQYENNKRQFDSPESKIESELTVGNAKKCYQAADNILTLFLSKLSEDDRMDLTMDSYHGYTRRLPA